MFTQDDHTLLVTSLFFEYQIRKEMEGELHGEQHLQIHHIITTLSFCQHNELGCMQEIIAIFCVICA
jgi:hypothetical protein